MGEQAKSNRRMLTAGVIILAAAAVVFAAAAIITGQSRWNGVALTSALAALGPGSQLMFGTLRLEWAATWAAVVIAVGQGLSDVPETQTLAGVALVTLAVSAATFLRRRVQVWSAGLLAVAIVLVSVWWNPDQGLGFGLGLAAGFVFLVWIQLEMQAAYRRDRKLRLRSDALIHRSSVPILGFDFSTVRPELVELNAEHEDLEAFLRTHPQLLDRLLSEVRVTDLNHAAKSDLAAEALTFPIPASTGINIRNVDATASWLTAVARGQRQWDGDLWLTKNGGGGLWYRIRHIVPGDDQPDYSHTIVTGMNITELKDVQSALRELDNAKNEFIATIAHEMRTPMAGVVGFSAELAQNLNDYPEEMVIEMVELIGRQARELSYILDDLMAVAAAEMSALRVANESFDVAQLVDDVVNTVGIPIDVVVEGAPRARADKIRVGQILRNLLTNVERYGGSTRRLEVLEAGGRVRISVIDDGPGMSEKRIEQVFGSFGHVGSSDVVGSMGLGLNVSRTLADLMGADLVYERVGGETHFSVDLRLVEAPDVTRADS